MADLRRRVQDVGCRVVAGLRRWHPIRPPVRIPVIAPSTTSGFAEPESDQRRPPKQSNVEVVIHCTLHLHTGAWLGSSTWSFESLLRSLHRRLHSLRTLRPPAPSLARAR